MKTENYNIGYRCTTAHCLAGRGERVAMKWIDAHLVRHSITFADLDRSSNRFANLLESLGIRPGEVIFTFLPKLPEQFVAFLGALKAKIVVGTLFSNSGPESVLDRVGDAKARVIITKNNMLKKITAIRQAMPDLAYIILVDSDIDLAPDILSLSRLMECASDLYDVPDTSINTPSVLHYTSGSTGKPKGVLHVHGSLEMQQLTACETLGLDSNDCFWCTADQGWVTGTSYGIIAPWSLGATQIHYGGGYDPERWLEILEQEKVTVWYTAPTVLRMMMREDESLFDRFQLTSLRHISSVGEPLNPEVIHWGRRVLGKEIYDTWFQTETGAIMIANRPGLLLRPGSMGKPVTGIEPVILSDDGTQLSDGIAGNLCLKENWPSMFVTYLNRHDAYLSRFKDGYYYTGDQAWRDEDGYFWFQGRSDDIINTAGHLVSPFEVESSLIEVMEVAEAGVIGVPDDLLYEKIVAFVSLHRGHTFTPELELKIRLHISNKLSTVATPHEVVPVENIPKNKSGKIMRRVLKALYLGIDPGDISTMED